MTEQAGRRVREEALSEVVARGVRAGEIHRRAAIAGARRSLPSDMSAEMFPVLVNHVMHGSPEALRYAELLEADAAVAPPSDGLRLAWMHLIPNMQPAVREVLDFSDRVHLVACDIVDDTYQEGIDPARPYEAMARRMVYSPYNGDVTERVRRVLEVAEATDANGVVLFAQWGCKATIGAAPLIKRRLEEAGLPCLVLDGDGCDQTNASDGQTATRLGAFLEMLEARREGAA